MVSRTRPGAAEQLTTGAFLWRSLVVAAKLVAAAMLARQGELFFYQGF